MNSSIRFEKTVYSKLSSLVSEGALGLSSGACKLRLNPRYPSKARKGHIVFDIAIEVSIAGAEKPSIIWIWECKSSRLRISIDEVEEFWAKLQQIGSAKTKGTMVAAGGFQRACFEFADSVGLGLVRYCADDKLDHILYGKGGTPTLTKLSQSLLRRYLEDERVVLPNIDLVAYCNGQAFPSLSEFLILHIEQ